MVVVQERPCETREGVSCPAGERSTDWEAVIATHRIDDWPPPEWLATVGEGPARA